MNIVMMILQSIVLPKVQKQAAVYAADFLNRRRRQRLGLPEPESETRVCSPCPEPVDCSARANAMKAVFSVAGSVLAGAVLGTAVGALAAKK